MTNFEEKRYREWAEKSMAETSYGPPRIRKRMEDFTDGAKTGPLGVASECAALSDESI